MTAEAIAEKMNRAAVTRAFRNKPSDVLGALRQTDDRSIDGVRGKWHSPRVSYPAVVHPVNEHSPVSANAASSVTDAVTIGMFDPTLTPELTHLAQEILGPGIRLLAAYSDPDSVLHEERRRIRYFPSEPEGEYYKRRRKQRTAQISKAKKRINRNAYNYIETELGANSQSEALTIFQRHAEQADSSVLYHTAQLYPEDVSPAIPDIVAHATTPAALASTYFSADPEVRFAAQRKMLLTLLSMQLEREGRKGADRKLEQVHKLLEKELFESGPHAAKDKEVYAIVDDETNELIVLDEEPTEPAPQGYHYNHYTYQGMRRIKGTNIDGKVMIGKKATDSAESKALFKAKRRADEGDSDDIRPADVDDSHRMMIVVNGKDEDAERVRQLISYMLINNEGFLCDRQDGKPILGAEGNLVGAVTDINPKDTAQKTNGSAEKLGHKRVVVKFAGFDAPFEIIVKSIERDRNYYDDIGVRDPETGKYSGIAHEPFKVLLRAPGVDEVLFPRQVFPDLPRPYEKGPDGEFPPHPVLERIIYELQHANRYEPACELAAA